MKIFTLTNFIIFAGLLFVAVVIGLAFVPGSAKELPSEDAKVISIVEVEGSPNEVVLSIRTVKGILVKKRIEKSFVKDLSEGSYISVELVASVDALGWKVKSIQGRLLKAKEENGNW